MNQAKESGKWILFYGDGSGSPAFDASVNARLYVLDCRSSRDRPGITVMPHLAGMMGSLLLLQQAYGTMYRSLTQCHLHALPN
jgi:hypothetical protein